MLQKASGLKCCLEYKNIARGVPIAELDRIGMLDISCTDDARFARHTDESVFEMAIICRRHSMAARRTQG